MQIINAVHIRFIIKGQCLSLFFKFHIMDYLLEALLLILWTIQMSLWVYLLHRSLF